MAEGIINKGLTAVENKGVIHTLKRALAYLSRYISHLYREYSSCALSIFLGHEPAWKICLAVYKFRCKHGLLGNGRSLWVGKSLRNCAYKTAYINPAEVNHVIKGGIVPYIQDGDWVWVETPQIKGERVKFKVCLTEDIDPRMVHAQHGWWFPEKPAPEHGCFESNIDVVMSDDPPREKICGSVRTRGTLCRIYK